MKRNVQSLPFKTGGFGARFGFPWFITGFVGKLLLCDESGLSNVGKFTLLAAFLCRVLVFVWSPVVFILGELELWCKPFVLPFLCK